MLGWFNKKNKQKPSVKSSSEELGRETAELDESVANDANQVSPQVDSGKTPDKEVFQEQSVESAEKQPEKQRGLFKRLQERLGKTRDSMITRLDRLFLGKKEIDAELLEDLEEILITADLGVNTTVDLLDDVRTKVSRQELNDPQALKQALKERILSFFEGYAQPADITMPSS